MRSGSRRYATFLAVVCLALVWALPAEAHVQERTDPNETTGPLDLRRATFSHPEKKVKSTLTTQGDWTAATLDDGSQLLFHYDSRGNDFGDFYVRVKKDPGGGLQGRLFEGGDPLEGGGQFVANVHAHRDGRKLVVRFPIERIDPRPGYIGWAALSKYKGSAQCAGQEWGCYDVMPDGSFYRHNL